MLAGGYEESLVVKYAGARERLGPLQQANRRIKELEMKVRRLEARTRELESNSDLQDKLGAAFPQGEVARIKAAVGNYYGVDVIDITSNRRTAEVVKPRQVAMYLAKTLTTRSLSEIGRFFGRRDHTTILHGVRKITGLRATDPVLHQELTELEAVLK